MVKFAGQLGQWLAKFRRETQGITQEFKEAFDLELMNPTSESNPRAGAGGDPSATNRQWNLPTTNENEKAIEVGRPSAEPAVEDPSAAASPATEPHRDIPPALAQAMAASQGIPYGGVEGADDQTKVSPEVVELAVEVSPDAEPVELGIAQWVPEDDDIEATVVGEPVWVQAPDEDTGEKGDDAGRNGAEDVA